MPILAGLFRTWENASRAVDLLSTSGHRAQDISVIIPGDIADQHRDKTEDVGRGLAAGGAGTDASTNSGGAGLAGYVAATRPVSMAGYGPVVVSGPLATTGPAGTTPSEGAPLPTDVDSSERVPGAGKEFKPDDEDQLFDALVRTGIPGEMAAVYADGVKRGYILVAVDSDQAADARNLMLQANAADVDALRREWQRSGYSDESSTR